MYVVVVWLFERKIGVIVWIFFEESDNSKYKLEDSLFNLISLY